MISGSLVKLGKSAAVTRTDTLTFWNRATDNFPAELAFKARLYTADQFKSIYHRPTRRETVSLDPAQVVADSLVVKHLDTQEVFIMSAVDRFDSAHDSTYDRARALHRAYKGEVFREILSGSGDDLGPVSRESQGLMFGDLELRTEEKIPDTHRELGGSFFLTCPDDPDLQVADGDYFVFSEGPYSGNELRIREVYSEAGFQMSRAESRGDNIETLTYELITAAGAYNPTTGGVTEPTSSDRLFSGTVTDTVIEEMGDRVAGEDITIYVYTAHVGFDFKIDGVIRRGSDSFKVYSTGIGADGLQWVVKARRTPA